MNSKKFFEDRLIKAGSLFDKCDVALTYYNAKDNAELMDKVTIGHPIYAKQKETLEEDRNAKVSFLDKLKDYSLEEIDELAKYLEKHKVKDNEEFVDDFLTLLKEYQSRNDADRKANDIVLDVFANYVSDQMRMSSFDVMFYCAVLDRINELESESDRENS